ncbi:MAG: hypothetical protein CXT73_04890 [Methanobacteriota archaeon]|nr:MAG: hypothetical protein CXT73_04890 [Euryarchaeota archaeon]
MSLLLDKFKTKKTPSKLSTIKIKMQGRQVGSPGEQLDYSIFERKIASRFNKPSISKMKPTQFKEDDKLIKKLPKKLGRTKRLPGEKPKQTLTKKQLNYSMPFFKVRKELIKIKDGQGKLLVDRLPEPQYESFNINPPAYYQHNRDYFTNFINSTFGNEYTDQIKSDKNQASCDDFNDKSNFSLLTHQKIVRDYINLHSPYRGLLLYHGLGAGKTCSSIAITEGIKSTNTVVVMTPASLQSNYIKELKKCGDPLYKDNQYWEFIKTENESGVIDKDLEKALSSVLHLSPAYIRANKGAWLVDKTKPANFNDKHQRDRASITDQINNMIRHKYQFINYNGINHIRLDGYETESKKIHGRNNIFDNKIVIIDEAHNFVSRVVNKIEKDPKRETITMKLYDYLLDANNCRIVLLTGTPVVNYPNEIGILFNILRGYIKTFYFTLDTSHVNSLDQDKIIKIFKKNGFVDYIFYDPNTRILKITRNPYGFVNYVSNEQYKGLIRNKRGKIDDGTFQEVVVEVLKKHNILIEGTPGNPESNLALPDTFKTFNNKFVDVITKELKNKLMFSRRILGLTSYFRSAQESLLPKFNPDTDIDDTPIEMSTYQVAKYEEARMGERTEGKNKKKPKQKTTKRGIATDQASALYSDNPGTYRVFSRLFCNFVFPEEIRRPLPSDFSTNKSIDKSVIDGLSIEERKESGDGRFDVDDAKKENTDSKKAIALEYTKSINAALKELREKSSKYLDMNKSKKLEELSPKFAKILHRLSDHRHRGCHLIYSDFRTLEGIGILSMVLEAQTGVPWSRFKIKKDGEGIWKVNMNEEDLRKNCYALYTGTEDADEKEIVRKIFNSEWDAVPKTIIETLNNEGFDEEKNLYGDVIKTLMITSSGSEGIDLKNVRFVHIMDPYWHPVRTEQVIGRARRICSHHALPSEPVNYRTVKVYLYIMTFSQKQREHQLTSESMRHDKSPDPEDDPTRVITTDEYLYIKSNMKAKINKAILNVIKSTAIDCALYKDGRKKENILCYNYGSFDKSTYHSKPNYKKELLDKQWLVNRKKITKKIMHIKIPRGEYYIVLDNPDDPEDKSGIVIDKDMWDVRNTQVPIMRSVKDPENPGDLKMIPL